MQGQCLCGAIRFEVTGNPKGVSMCHCGQCRRQSGGVWASAFVPLAEINITGPVNWYRSSDTAQRGSCATCGSFLFWKADDEDQISFALGALDSPTGLRIAKHIFVGDKGDYYDIADDVPQQGA